MSLNAFMRNTLKKRFVGEDYYCTLSLQAGVFSPVNAGLVNMNLLTRRSIVTYMTLFGALCSVLGDVLFNIIMM